MSMESIPANPRAFKGSGNAEIKMLIKQIDIARNALEIEAEGPRKKKQPHAQTKSNNRDHFFGKSRLNGMEKIKIIQEK